MHLAMWPRQQIVRHVLSNVAVAIQRENATTVLAGHAAIDFSRCGPAESNHEGATDEDEDEEDGADDAAAEEEEEREDDDEGEERDEEQDAM